MLSGTAKRHVPITILIEGNVGDNNYSAYIPELRLGAMGDTLEEARQNVIDLAKVEALGFFKIAYCEPIIEKMNLEIG